MANIKSAKKRINTNKRERNENRYVKSTLATMVKNFRKLLAEGQVSEAEAKLNDTVSYINSACSKGVIHKNNANRKVARLHLALDKAKATQAPAVAPVKVAKKVEAEKVEAEKVEKVEEVKAEPVKKTTKKVAEKAETKTTTKKATTKKETAEKAPAEKAPAKKTTKKAETK